MAAGQYDNQSIWQHGEDDAYSTFSERLNKGLASVSERFRTLRDLVAGWAPKRAAGTFARPALANGAGLSITLNFPAGRFTAPPLVFIETAEARVAGSITARTATSATVFLANYSGGAAAAGTGFFEAVQANWTEPTS